MPGKAFSLYYRPFTMNGERHSTDNVKVGEKIVPFPENFRMVVTESMVLNKILSTPSMSTMDYPVVYKCHIDRSDPFKEILVSDPTTCVPLGGYQLKMRLITPSCWNGVDADSPDHSAHVAYPTGFLINSTCPSTHPVRIPTLFYNVDLNITEIRYLVEQGWRLAFPKRVDQFTPSGLSLFHVDFMNGWNQTFLSDAVTKCGLYPCPMVKQQRVCSSL